MPDKQTDFTRADAFGKVTGRELYAIDSYPDNMLWAGAKRAGIPHGIIKNIDAADALKLKGVLAVLTAKDVPGSNRQGIIHKDMPVLADTKVRYAGDPVALVIAEDKSLLRKAIDLIRVDIEPLPGVFNVDAALEPSAPLVHEDHKNGNVLVSAEIKKGSGKEALTECDVIVEGSFTTPVQAHTFLETENGIARLEEDGTLTLTVSTQAPYRDKFEIAHALGLNPANIRVIAPYLGGGFGGKDGATVQCLLALAAYNSGGRPVKMVWEREESFLAGYKRHSARTEYRLGARSDGTLHALHCRLYYDTGAYAHLGGEVMGLGMEHAGGPYRIPHTLIEGWCVYTNNPVAGAMRAFGVAQVSFAIEQLMDMLAEKLSMDPLELRIKNALVQGDTNCSGVRLETSTGIYQCLRRLQKHPLWTEREEWKKEAGPFKTRGVGMAAVHNAMGYGKKVRDSAIARVELSKEGRIVVYNSVSDMGQGNASAFAQIAEEILSQDRSSIILVQPDTAQGLPSGSSSAGRTTYTYGNALIKACEELKRRILNRAGLLLFVDDDSELTLEAGRVIHERSGKETSLERLAAFFPKEDFSCTNHFVTPVCKDVPDTGKGIFVGFPHIFFSYSAHLARIIIDRLTGTVEVKDYVAITDAGRELNPVAYAQQIEGGIAQGIGYALTEDFVVKNGIPQGLDLKSYIIPASMDIPDIISLTEETNEETGPFGMKGVGEVAMNGPLPAIANAIVDAGHAREFNAPITAERILKENK